jgi:hypothetical protein
MHQEFLKYASIMDWRIYGGSLEDLRRYKGLALAL